jgi:hypothetical protein
MIQPFNIQKILNYGQGLQNIRILQIYQSLFSSIEYWKTVLVEQRIEKLNSVMQL